MRFLFPIIFLVISLVASQSFAFAQQDQLLTSRTDKINEIQKDNQWKNFWVKGNYYNSTLDSELQVFKIPYKIDGGRVLKIVYDDKRADILVNIESKAKGTLYINIPRNLPVTNSGNEQSFPFIIVDGEETQVIEERDQCYRNFAIPFEKGNEEIELIGSLLLTAIQPYGLKVPDDCVITPSPRLQIELNGVPFEQIRCDKKLELIFKRTDSSPACVKPETKLKLIERGWGKDLSTILLKIPLPKISQTEAIKTVENDLKNHVKNSTKILRIVDDVGDQQKYIPFSEFQTNNKILPLVFVSTNGTLLTINNASLRINGWCNMGTYTYCGYMQPFNLDYKSRLVYGLDIIYGDNDADMQPAFYAVDAVSGEIVDSSFLRSEARGK